jgi:hypothetical protein
MIPKIILNDVKKTSDHAFELITSDENNIKCDMSWGNGGAGNQNPRVLFKLLPKGKTIKPAKSIKKEKTLKTIKSSKKEKTSKSIKSNDGDNDNQNKTDKTDKTDKTILGGNSNTSNTIKEHDYEHDYEYEWIENNEELAIGDVDGIHLLNKFHGNKDTKIEFEENNKSQNIINKMKLRSGNIYNIIKSKFKSNITKKNTKNSKKHSRTK